MKADEMQDDERRILRRCGLFEGLAAERVESILARAAVREFQRKEIVFHQGDAVTGLFVLVAGRVKLTQLSPEGDEVILRLLGPGEIFAGVAALERVGSYPVTTQALTESRAAFWGLDEVREIFSENPSLTGNLLQQITERTREFQHRLREVSTQKVPQRLAHMLLRLAQQAGRRAPGGLRIDFPLTRQDLAEMTGTTLYTVSRLLSDWSEREIVEVGREWVVVRSPDELQDIADEMA